MNRTMALLIVFALCGLFAAANSLAQVFAQPGAPATPPPAVAPRPVGPPELPGAPGAPPARVGVIQGAATLAAPAPAGGGGFIRAVGPGGAGGVVYQAGPGWGGDLGGFGLGAPGHDDPEMSKLMQTEHELARQSDDLVRQYSETEDYSQREKMRGQLRELLVKQFEVQQQRRERELSNVEQRLGKLREQLKKRTSARDTIVDRRLENITSDADGLGWNTPAGGGPQGINASIFGGQPPRPRPAVAR